MSMDDLLMERKHISHESWKEYEARWTPGSCPQENHQVFLTWLVTKHRLPGFVYERVRAMIEQGAEPIDRNAFDDEPGKHFPTTRHWGDESPTGNELAGENLLEG